MQLLCHRGSTQPRPRTPQTLQGRLDTAFTLPRRQVENLDILLGRSFRLLGHQCVIGQSKATAGEQFVPVAVLGKRPRLAYQPRDDVPIVDALLAPTTQPRQPLDLSLGIPHLQVSHMHPHFHPLANEPTVDRVGVAQHVDCTAAINPHRQTLAHVEPVRRQGP